MKSIITSRKNIKPLLEKLQVKIIYSCYDTNKFGLVRGYVYYVSGNASTMGIISTFFECGYPLECKIEVEKIAKVQDTKKKKI